MTPNVDLLRRTLAHIEANQRAWDQTVWRRKDPVCGTAMCFAGWAVTLDGEEWASEPRAASELNPLTDTSHLIALPSNYLAHVDDVAEEVLGLTPEQAGQLFLAFNDLDDIRRIVAEICESAS